MDHSSWAVTLGSLTCGEGGNLSTWDLGFIYVSSAGRVGCEFLHPAQPTDAPSSRRSSRSHFYTPGFPRGWQIMLSWTAKYEDTKRTRKFLPLRKNERPWLMYREETKLMFCTYCEDQGKNRLWRIINK